MSDRTALIRLTAAVEVFSKMLEATIAGNTRYSSSLYSVNNSAANHKLIAAYKEAAETLKLAESKQDYRQDLLKSLDLHQRAMIRALETQMTFEEARILCDAVWDNRVFEACQLLHERMAVKNSASLEQISLGQPFVFTLRVRGVVVSRDVKGEPLYTLVFDRRNSRDRQVGLVVNADEILSAIAADDEGEG